LITLASVALSLVDCASTSASFSQESSASVKSAPASASAGTRQSIALTCPKTTPPLTPEAGGPGSPLGESPDAALACLTNEPANKQAVVGAGTRIPPAVGAVLARLIDDAPAASAAVADRCAPQHPVLLIQFSYPAGPIDVIESVECSAGDVAYIDNRGYVLPPPLGRYLEAASTTSGGGFAPDLMGLTLPQASAVAKESGDTLALGGELADSAPNGTVLLQSPIADSQVDVIVSVGQSTPCRAGQLSLQYLPGAASAGNVSGTLYLWNSSVSWCGLTGPVTLTGLTDGAPVTKTIAVQVPPNIELSPNAQSAALHQALPVDQLAASILVTAEYRDDADGSLCKPHWVLPQTWRLALGPETLAVPNGRRTANVRPIGTGGLVTCRGQMGSGPLQIAGS